MCGGGCCGVIAGRDGVNWEGKLASLPTLGSGVAVCGWGEIGVRGKHPCHLEELQGVLAVGGVGVGVAGLGAGEGSVGVGGD